MKKVKLLGLFLFSFFVMGLVSVNAQSTVYVDVPEATIRLYKEREAIENSYESLKKAGLDQAYKLAQAKYQYYLSLHDAIRAADSVEIGIENTAPIGGADSFDATAQLSKQEVLTFQEEVKALLKL